MDTGQRSHGAEAQESVAYHMEQQLRPAKDDERPAFFYHLGDVVYYNGERDRYEGQFYEPYLHYTGPIFAIPGNHDGSTVPGGDSSLRGFVENFCASQPQHTWMAPGRPVELAARVRWSHRRRSVIVRIGQPDAVRIGACQVSRRRRSRLPTR